MVGHLKLVLDEDDSASSVFRARISAEKLSTPSQCPVSSSGTPMTSESWSMFSAGNGVNAIASCFQAGRADSRSVRRAKDDFAHAFILLIRSRQEGIPAAEIVHPSLRRFVVPGLQEERDENRILRGARNERIRFDQHAAETPRTRPFRVREAAGAVILCRATLSLGEIMQHPDALGSVLAGLLHLPSQHLLPEHLVDARRRNLLTVRPRSLRMGPSDR